MWRCPRKTSHVAALCVLQPRKPPGSYITEPFKLALNPSRSRILTHDNPFSFWKNFNYENNMDFLELNCALLKLIKCLFALFWSLLDKTQ